MPWEYNPFIDNLCKKVDPLTLRERAEPQDPTEGETVIWMSDGTGVGDVGDIMIKVNVGGIVKTATLLDFSILS